MIEVRLFKHLLEFKQPSGTSRGVLTDKPSWIFEAIHPSGRIVQGESSVIPGLSPDFYSEGEYVFLLKIAKVHLEHFINSQGKTKEFLLKARETWSNEPSILFALEMFVLKWENSGEFVFDNDVTKGVLPIPINGLVWMGSVDFMSRQIEEKLKAGFKTVKMKIGAIDLDDELELLFGVRRRFSASDITLRVDANGAFNEKNVRSVLKSLRELEIHSIEQPIAIGQKELMRDLCKENIIPIALDEELIGVNHRNEKEDLLQFIQPQFIILKPSLHGGITGCKEWIEIAQNLKMDWWMTSALESSIGLDAIAQFLGEYNIILPQGLGTGALYTNNFESDWKVENGFLVKS